MGIIAGFMVPHPPMIVPEVGKGSEEIVEETTEAYEKVADMVAELRPDTIVISSPHSVMYGDYFHISPGKHAKGSFASFAAPDVIFDVDYDEELVMQISLKAAAAGVDAGTMGERDPLLDHGTMVPLYFIMKKYTDFKLVRIGLSGLPLEEHKRLGQLISQAANECERRVVYIASGDLSHRLKEDGPYGFNPAGPVYDEKIMDVMGRAAFDELLTFDGKLLGEAAECGHRSFVMMSGALDKKNLSVRKLSHQDVTGVGYGICTYLVQEEDAYVRLARLSLETNIIEHRKIDWDDVKNEIMVNYADDADIFEKTEKELSETRAGAFVSLHVGDSLRGCIGTICATKDCLADEIIENAISASTRDPRFYPVTEDELESLEYSVDVLSEAEPISDIAELDVKKYGVIVTKGMHRGLLLPNLDGVDTVEEQLAIVKQKAGLSPHEDGCEIERFCVVRHY
ncbi:MAG: AmmeMemoRadiSam system protein A [Eubacterium sp.]|nr:AmmeMemoRadiSam system protein A [Eubacterium sp.]